MAKKPTKKPADKRKVSHMELMRMKPVLDMVQDSLDEAKNAHIAETLLMRKLPLPKGQ